jgi:bacteriocin biosynthesis cyclodehydratase domain-containing protein
VLPGIVGSLQANEGLKLIAGYGEPLVGRLLLFDAQSTRFSEVKARRDPACPVCGEDATRSQAKLQEVPTAEAEPPARAAS